MHTWGTSTTQLQSRPSTDFSPLFLYLETTRLFTRLLQGCLQGCYKVATRLLQGCLQGCYKVVTRLLQGCHKVVIVSIAYLSIAYL